MENHFDYNFELETRLKEKGEIEKAKSQLKIAQKIIDVFADDFLENKCFNKFIYEYTKVRRKEIEELLAK